MQLSSPEYCWAPVIAIAKAIHDGVGDDVLELYRACLMNTPLRLEIYDNAQDRLWRARQLRQDEAHKGSAAKPTPRHSGSQEDARARTQQESWRGAICGKVE